MKNLIILVLLGLTTPVICFPETTSELILAEKICKDKHGNSYICPEPPAES